jgi:hypothetical protein
MSAADVDAAAAASASGSLVTAHAGSATEEILGPRLYVGMGEAAMVERMNTWGAVRDQALLDLRADLLSTKVVVASTFEDAQAAVRDIVTNSRAEAEALRQHGHFEAHQALDRLTLVVTEARAKFDAQDTSIAQNLAELARRQQALEDWARGEPARMAALARAVPVPPRVITSPGGTVTFYPAPAAPTTPPPRAAAAPVWDASPSPQAPGATPAWDAWAVGRGASPQGRPPQDPWAAAAQQQQQQPPHYNISSPPGFGGGGGGKPRDLRINTRDWSDSRKLDVTTTFEQFQVWKDRATMFLSKERPDVRALLTWAETQSQAGLDANLAAQSAQLGVDDLALVEFTLHDGIKNIVVDGLLGRARNCIGKGCELWRALVAEWSGGGDHVRDAKARRYLDPPRAKDTAELWAKLSSWERLGEEVVTSGLPLPEWMRNTSLEKLLPTQLLSTLVSRSDLKEYSVRLAWVKTQMEHTRGVQQAAAYGPGVGKDASGDVYMSSVEAAAAEHSDTALSWALANAVDQGDWAQAETFQNAISALKGAGKGGYRKGKGKGKSDPAAAAKGAGAGAGFNGNCLYCGIWGHRRSECRRLDTDMGKKGGAKGDKGDKGGKNGKNGKGGSKGGKGPSAEPLHEVAPGDEGDWAAALAAAGDGDYADEEWGFGALCSLTPWEPTPVKHDPFDGPIADFAPWVRVTKRGRKTWRPFGTVSGAPTAVQNSYAGLNSLLDDTAVLLSTSAGKQRGGRVVEAVIDSGAVHCVTPPGCFPGQMVPSPWSRAGRGYRAANGTAIKNLGQVDVPFATAEGHRCRIPFQVAEVEQPLVSVACLTSAGNIVQLGDTDGHVVNTSTGRSIALERRGNIYYMQMFVPDAAAPLPFRRQGA